MALTRKGRALAARQDRERQRAAQQLFGDVDEAELATFLKVLNGVLAKTSKPGGPV